jgi:hypothetical protein
MDRELIPGARAHGSQQAKRKARLKGRGAQTETRNAQPRTPSVATFLAWPDSQRFCALRLLALRFAGRIRDRSVLTLAFRPLCVRRLRVDAVPFSRNSRRSAVVMIPRSAPFSRTGRASIFRLRSRAAAALTETPTDVPTTSGVMTSATIRPLRSVSPARIPRSRSDRIPTTRSSRTTTRCLMWRSCIRFQAASRLSSGDTVSTRDDITSPTSTAASAAPMRTASGPAPSAPGRAPTR